MSNPADPANIPNSRLSLRQMQPLAQAALAQYGIVNAKLKNLRYYNNATYRVSAGDGDRYVLRVTSNFYSAANLQSEMLWLQTLQHDPALFVPTPMPSLDCSMVVTAAAPAIAPPRLCVLFRWMEGAKVAEERMKINHFRLVGEALARLHRQSIAFTPPAAFNRPSWDEGRFLSPEMAATREQIYTHLAKYFTGAEVRRFVELTDQARATMRLLADDLTSFGLIHGDFHAGNYLFNRGTVRFIDFEDSGWGYFLYDMATALFGIIESAAYDLLAAAFFAGYARVRPLPDQLAARLRQFQIVRCIFLTGLVVTSGSVSESQWWEQYVAGRLRKLLQNTPLD